MPISNNPTATVLNVVQPAIGIGTLQPIPTSGSSSAPVAIGTVPSGSVGFRLYLNTASQSVTGTFAASSSAAATLITNGNLITFSNALNAPAWDENLGAGLNFWVSAVTGTIMFRYF